MNFQIKNARYLSGAAKPRDLIVSDVPQIAVVGKSNVGKSSFINTLCRDGKLARTSKQPGRTRLINYFLINADSSEEFILADLPGYGFARVSDAEKRNWANLIETYLAEEQRLLHVFFLLDCRHEPTSDDKVMYNYLFKSNLPFTAVATKADKLSKSTLYLRRREIASSLKLGEGNVIPFSSETALGKDQILQTISQTLFPDQTD